MTSKPIEPKKQIIPGPGTYSILTKSETPSVVFGSESRDKLIKSEGPGPAAYNV